MPTMTSELLCLEVVHDEGQMETRLQSACKLQSTVTFVFQFNPFSHTGEVGINEIKHGDRHLTSSDVTVDNCLVSQPMLCLISKVTFETEVWVHRKKAP